MHTLDYFQLFQKHITPHITGSKKQSEERAALFAVRVHVIVSCQLYASWLLNTATNQWLTLHIAPE